MTSSCCVGAALASASDSAGSTMEARGPSPGAVGASVVVRSVSHAVTPIIRPGRERRSSEAWAGHSFRWWRPIAPRSGAIATPARSAASCSRVAMGRGVPDAEEADEAKEAGSFPGGPSASSAPAAPSAPSHNRLLRQGLATLPPIAQRPGPGYIERTSAGSFAIGDFGLRSADWESNPHSAIHNPQLRSAPLFVSQQEPT